MESDNIEALFNLSIVNQKLNKQHEALGALEKLRSMNIKTPEVIFQIVNIYEQSQDYKNALKWLEILINLVPNDPNLTNKLAMFYFCLGDES